MSPYTLALVLMLPVVVLIRPLPAAAGPPATGTEMRATVTVGEKVNINTADVNALMKLDGIGRKVAEKIVEYRQANGPFKKPEEIRRVRGVGRGLWERNRERIVVE